MTALHGQQLAFRLWIEQIRRRERINQATLADRAGVSRSTISRYISGAAAGLPDIATINKIAAVYGPPPAALLPAEPLPPASPVAADQQLEALPPAGNRSESAVRLHRVLASNLSALDIEAGDLVTSRVDLKPASGDLVLARVDNGRLGLWRYFLAGGLALLARGPEEPPRLCDGDRTRIESVAVLIERSLKS